MYPLFLPKCTSGFDGQTLMRIAQAGGFTIRALIVNGPDASYNYSWDE